MKKELIMFIAYKTTENLVTREGGRSSHFNRAKAFMAITIAINIVELALILNLLLFHKTVHVSGWAFPLVYAIPLLIFALINFLFGRNTLARSLKLYKGSNVEGYGRVVGLLYFFLNFAITIFLVHKMRTIGYLPY